VLVGLVTHGSGKSLNNSPYRRVGSGWGEGGKGLAWGGAERKSPEFANCKGGPPSSKKSVATTSVIIVSILSVKAAVTGRSSMVGREGVRVRPGTGRSGV
jgi:hypothetical protein